MSNGKTIIEYRVQMAELAAHATTGHQLTTGQLVSQSADRSNMRLTAGVS